MISFKRFFIMVTAVLFIASTVFAQTGQRRELTVEESYLQEAIELMIIRETARSRTREQKMISLEFIREALDRGNTHDEIRQTLAFLAEESRRSIVIESGRIVNNFPDVRRQAVRLLGQVGTEEAAQSLREALLVENEPMVIQEAIRSLGIIGENEDNQTVLHIAWVFERFDNLNPDNLMALSIIDAFENIARTNNGLTAPEAIRTLFRISEGSYITPVRERARQLLADLRSYGN
ncbi:MAG: HEAT repeat domain-containing protein [Treponema sp.]|nr:HEAT repeat domain-containing protein [Treponema sp.]